jgi:hypothetical protein
MAKERMTGLENLLGGMFGVKRRQPWQLEGASSVLWLALTADYDRIELRNIKEARAVAKSGWVYVGPQVEENNGYLKIESIRREQGSQNPHDNDFEIPNGILQERDKYGNLTEEYGK